MKTKTALIRLLAQLKPYKFLLVMSFLSSIMYAMFTLLIPVLIGNAVDAAVGVDNVDTQQILVCMALIAALAIAASLAQWAMGVSTTKLSSYVAKDLCNNVFDTLNNVPLSYIDTNPHGDLMSRIVNDSTAVAEGFRQGLVQLLPGVATICGTLVVMIVLNPAIAAVVVCVTPLSILFASFMARRTSRYFKSYSAAQGQISAYVNEVVPAHSLVHAFGYEGESIRKFDELTDEIYNSGVKSTFYSSVTNPGTRFVNAIVYAAVGVIGAIVTVNGGMSIGQLTSFLTYANQYTKPFNEVSGVLTQVQSAVAGLKRIYEVIDAETQAPDKSDAIDKVDCKGKVDVDDIWFSYKKGEPFFKGISISAKPGERIAIVGPTGCGKTTLINLLMRFYEVDKGAIYVDDTDSTNYKRSALRGMYGMVLQDTWLKNVSVRDNIAYGRPNATQEQIVNAAKAAHAHSFIKRLPNGYDTVIGTGGGNLSAGQKQLLCIARIMLCEPDMLILDEATSSIDTRTEMLVQAAFDKLMHDRTSFVVAHRLSTIQTADKIVVVKDGQIEEQGTHEELMANGAFYKGLYSSRFDVG